MPAASATAMIRYFQSGYRFMARESVVAAGAARTSAWPRGKRALSTRSSQRLDRALGQQLGDRAALDRHLGIAGDLDRHVLVADPGDPAEDAAGGDHFVALLQRFEHRL